MGSTLARFSGEHHHGNIDERDADVWCARHRHHLDDQQAVRRRHLFAAPPQDGEALRVGPIVKHLTQKPDIACCRDWLEETAADQRTPVADSPGSEQSLSIRQHLPLFQQRAADVRVRAEDGR